MKQDRLTDIGTLTIESSFVHKVNFALHNKRLERHTFIMYICFLPFDDDDNKNLMGQKYPPPLSVGLDERELDVNEEGRSGANDETTGEVVFKHEVFYVLMDAVIAGFTTRYSAVKRINSQCSFFWQYFKMSKLDLKLNSQRFVHQIWR